MIKKTKLIAGVCIAAFAGILLTANILSRTSTAHENTSSDNVAKTAVPSSFTAPDAVAGSADTIINTMTVGWNLGNTFDSTASRVRDSALKRTADEGTDYETLWGNPVTTQAMIQAVHIKGFNTIRIPVTWAHHLIDGGSGNVKISESFLKELKKVVDYAYEDGMYVIINSHHDASDYSNGMTMAEAGDTGLTWPMLYPYQLFNAGDTPPCAQQCENIRRLWKAVAAAFKDYDSRLIFEGFNEIQGESRDWDAPSAAELANTNRLNNAFVEAVRDEGGRNADRVLMVETYAGYYSADCMNALDVSDSADDALIEQVHMYGNAVGEELASSFKQIKEQAKYPVVIGEFGFKQTAGTSLELAKNYYDASRQSREYGIPLIYWDDGQTGLDNYGLLNRKTLTWDIDGCDVASYALGGWYEAQNK